MTVTVKRGDSISLLFSAKDADGVAQPLVDVEARIQLRDRGGNVFIESTSNPLDGLTIDEVAGTIAWEVPYEDTEVLDPGTYYSDLELTYGTGERVSSDTFPLRIVEDITRDVA